MSNSHKVRIYELSKELNLENKDILAVCEKLDIAVKNHSSTITEADAAKIRDAAAQKRPSGPRTTPPRRTASAKDEKGRKPRPVAKPNKQDRPKKQQILELRKQKTKPPAEPMAPSSAVKAARPPESLQAPKPIRPQPTQGAEKPTLTPKPTVASQPPSTSVPKASAPGPALSPPPRTDKVLTKPATQVPEIVKPQLLKKPTLNQPAEPTVPEVSQTAPPTKPPVSNQPEKTVETEPPRPRLVRPISIAKAKAEAKAAAETSQSTAGSASNDTTELLVLTPPTSRQKKDKRSSKPEEFEDRPAKVSKSSLKQKRRTQKEIEEDEDDLLAADDTHNQAVIDVSQSLVRPPKPKSMKQSKPATVPINRTPSSSKGNRRQRNRYRQQQEAEVERPTTLTLTTELTVQNLALQLVVPETEVIKILFMKGIAANINQVLDIETATMVAEELDCIVETQAEESEARKVSEMLDVEDLENLQSRPPVVTIMGHVDHGKTTLLDAIRETKVAQGEAGGITQHIGAYHVDLPHEDGVQQVVFLDTPGHEAFTAMRARGTRVTDIAILVVAADDGVRPQTLEAISHARAAKVPIIVAINKIDKEGAQLDRVRQELSEHELVPEDWGGETVMVPVSALKGENLDTLLEMILLVAEVEDLQANPNRPAKGTVIEAHLDKAKGPVASLLVQNGTLRVGDVLVAGSVFGKVRAMVDDRGDRVDTASPSFAVEVLGMSEVPAAGEEFEVFTDEKEARSQAGQRTDQQRHTRLQQAMASRRVSLNALSEQAREGELKELNLIIKADVQGSVEALLGSLAQLPQNEVQVRVLLSAPGEISETDVDLAAASGAVIIGFNTSLASGARQAADRAGVDIREYDIIYKLLEDIEGAMEGLLEPEFVEEDLGEAEVRAVFPVGRGAIAGCYIQSGKLVRNCRLRVQRNNEIVFEGFLDSLKRMKDDVREVNSGYECGVGVDNFSGWTEGDRIEAYQMVTKRRTLSAT
ncbi:translation initiation factor IF-2 [Acaryochloris sp. IP29b_bin.137]|uniref:translation initiation factor IF-2 n=1 Tax=Acaryochloris sp. IP29b_bin.137 TaxID=2969217 RepID=UPI00261D4126|nr:translation initiation factor IF-2 [Acaryochloris sp. IP29b_bin.137]